VLVDVVVVGGGGVEVEVEDEPVDDETGVELTEDVELAEDPEAVETVVGAELGKVTVTDFEYGVSSPAPLTAVTT
jgi:hypothetical protein